MSSISPTISMTAPSNAQGPYHFPPLIMQGEQTRTLWCVVDPDDDPAPVKVPESANIDSLKEAVKEKFGLHDVSTNKLVLWKLINPEPMDCTLPQRIKSYGNVATLAEKLTPFKQVSAFFPPYPLEGHVHVLVELLSKTSRKHPRSSSAEDGDRESKREKTYEYSTRANFGVSRERTLSAAEDAHETKKKQDGTTYRNEGTTPQLIRNTAREWAVNRAIRSTDMDGCYFVDPGIQNCLDALLISKFVLLVGARASGKTTRLFRLKRELEAKNYLVIYLSFKHVSWDNVQAFWNTFGFAVQAAASTGPFAVFQDFTPLSSLQDFLTFFHTRAWKRKIILVIDEFSDLYRADVTIGGECLRAFNEMRNNQEPYAIRGIIAAGTSAKLNVSLMFTAPFSTYNHVRNPYFTIDETRKLFLEFAQDNFITTGDAIIDDVWAKSNGHPGMVCLCGRAISENLSHMLTFPTRVLSYKRWKAFSAMDLLDWLYGNDTFQTMIVSLLRERATPAVNLLRSHFVGFFDTVYIHDAHKEWQADFLTAEGVLLQSAPQNYRLASVFVDELIRRYLIPQKFPSAPSTPFPMDNDGRFHVLEGLTESLKLFDKDLIRLAAVQSCKQSNVNVGGLRPVRVPRESVYETELMRILTNWVGKQEGYGINGHWHVPTDQNQNKYFNIILSALGTPPIILNILATGDVDFVQAHIDKIPYYKDILSSDEAWVVHFTCEDDYLDHPTWQSDEQLQSGGINVIHFWHDQDFKTVSMSARWQDGDGINQYINNQQVAL